MAKAAGKTIASIQPTGMSRPKPRNLMGIACSSKTKYAILTDEITRAWSGMNTREYKQLKGLKKESLRDNMSTLELVLNMLAEATTTELSKGHQPDGLTESQEMARRGTIAGNTRKAIEQDTGKPVITAQNALEMNRVLPDMIDSIGTLTKSTK